MLALIGLICAVPAQAAKARLTEAEVARVDAARRILAEVDTRPLQAIVGEINEAPYPEGNLQIYEAVAATYRELVKAKEITEIGHKQSLYNSIRMNVAFLQFGGDINHTGDKLLHQWIRQELRRHLPEGLMENEQLFYSLE